MAQLEDKIATTLDQVITSDWTGQGRGGGSDKKVKRVSKGRGKGRRIVKGVARGFRALRSDSKGQGKRLLPRKAKGRGKEQAGKSRVGGGLVKKSMFKKERRMVPVWRTTGKDRPKGSGKGSSKGPRRALRGKGRGKWSEEQSGTYRAGALKLWQGARSSKGKSKGKGKQRQQEWPAQGGEQWQRRGFGSRKGKGKGKRSGKGQSRTPDIMRVRRDGGIQKRQGKGGTGKGAMGGARALAIATGGNLRGWGKSQRAKASGGKGQERRRGNPLSDSRMAPDEHAMMKKIVVVAQLDKVPKPTPAMQGFSMDRRGGSRGSSERAGSLSRRFGRR